MEKAKENKKEDAKALGKFITVFVVAGIIGGICGFFGTFLADIIKGDIWGNAKQLLGIFSPIAMYVLTTGVLVFDFVQEKKCRKRFEAWDGEDENVYDWLDEKLNYVLMAASLNMILGYFFFGAAMYCEELWDSSSYEGASLWYAAITIAGLLYVTAVVIRVQKRVVNFSKEMNPEKRGSVYDTKFQKKWMESCDEAERLLIYKACYKAYMVTQSTCVCLWVVTTFGLMIFDTGLLPMVCVIIIWLAATIGYLAESMRLSKHPTEIMK